jgi:hypothetical protein
MSDLMELLERVKAATGPDRELDAAIAAHFRYHPYGPDHWLNRSPEFRFFPTHDGWLAIECDGEMMPRDAWASPEYTESVDAALALIKRQFPSACIYPDITPGNHACGLRYGPSHKDTSFSAGATPAMAILAALLSALTSGASS